DAAVARTAPAARALLAEFEEHEPWGWKDPRTSLTLPFWQTLVEPKLVVCLRNPLEVAVSLHRRNSLSYTLAVALWHDYNERVLAATPAEGRVVTHYDAYFRDALREVERVLDATGLPVS